MSAQAWAKAKKSPGKKIHKLRFFKVRFLSPWQAARRELFANGSERLLHDVTVCTFHKGAEKNLHHYTAAGSPEETKTVFHWTSAGQAERATPKARVQKKKREGRKKGKEVECWGSQCQVQNEFLVAPELAS